MLIYKTAIPYFIIYFFTIPLMYFYDSVVTFNIIQFILTPLIGIWFINIFNHYKYLGIIKKYRNLTLFIRPMVVFFLKVFWLLLIAVFCLSLPLEILKLLGTQLLFFSVIGLVLFVYTDSIETTITVYVSFLLFVIVSKGQIIPYLNPFLFYVEIMFTEYVYNSFNLIVLSGLGLYLIYIKSIK